MPRDTSYSYVSLLVAGMLIAGLLSSGPILAAAHDALEPNSTATASQAQPTTTVPAESTATASGAETTTPSDEVERHLGPVTVTVLLNCSYFEVTVEPTTYQYTLALDYRDTTTGQRIPMLAGPFTGTIDDPFGETDLRLVEVQVRVDGLPPITELAPERCLDR